MEYANQLVANVVATGPAADQLGLVVHNKQSLLIDQVVARQLHEIKVQIDLLPDPQNADQVIELLNARREYMFLILDVCLSSVLNETFLANGNEHAYRELVAGSQYPLAEMSNQCKPSLEALDFPIPEPLLPFDDKARQLFPWLSFLNTSGPFTIQYPRLSSIEYNIRLCLAGLRPVDKPTVHGELLSMMLALEDVLENGEIPESEAGQPLSIENYENLHYLLGRRFRNKRKEIAPTPITAVNTTVTTGKDENETKTEDAGQSTIETAQYSRADADDESSQKNTILSRSGVVNLHAYLHEKHLYSYDLIKRYLILRKRVESLKPEWGKRRLGLEDFNTSATFKLFVSTKYALGPYQESGAQISPKGISEVVILQHQLVKLIESFENYIIGDIWKALFRQIDLVIKEGNREEGNLSHVLWKKPALKESLTVPRPPLVNELLENLMSEAREDTNRKAITFDTDHLNEVIQNIAINVMRIQREAYEHCAMYYENLLKHQHMLLYSRKLEVLDLREQLKQMELEEDINVQFRISEEARNLLLVAFHLWKTPSVQLAYNRFDGCFTVFTSRAIGDLNVVEWADRTVG
nr:hypothetical protein HmN_000637100 [Hymenolepis microstoma]